MYYAHVILLICTVLLSTTIDVTHSAVGGERVPVNEPGDVLSDILQGTRPRVDDVTYLIDILSALRDTLEYQDRKLVEQKRPVARFGQILRQRPSYGKPRPNNNMFRYG